MAHISAMGFHEDGIKSGLEVAEKLLNPKDHGKTIFVEDCLFKGTVFHERFCSNKT